MPSPGGRWPGKAGSDEGNPTLFILAILLPGRNSGSSRTHLKNSAICQNLQNDEPESPVGSYTASLFCRIPVPPGRSVENRPVPPLNSPYNSKNLHNTDLLDTVSGIVPDMSSKNHTKGGFLPLSDFFAVFAPCDALLSFSPYFPSSAPVCALGHLPPGEGFYWAFFSFSAWSAVANASISSSMAPSIMLSIL